MATSPAAPPRPAPETPHPSGRPAGQAGAVAWIAVAVRRRWAPGLVALVCAWSGVWLAVWLVVADALAGAVLSALGSAIGAALAGAGSPPAPGAAPSRSPAAPSGRRPAASSPGFGPGRRRAARSSSAPWPAGWRYRWRCSRPAWRWSPGCCASRGCRRLSRREAARVMPLLERAAADLGLASLPLVLMADGDDLRVRVHSRHLVIGRGLLDELGDGPRRRRGPRRRCSATRSTTGRRATAWGCLGPLLRAAAGAPLQRRLLAGAAGELADRPGRLDRALAGVAAGPAGHPSRSSRWARAARSTRPTPRCAATGRGEALHRALSLLGELEPGRSGWDRVIAATHPPRELRLEALEPDPES